MARRVGSRIASWLLAGTLLVLGVIALGSAPANAGPYPPTQCATLSVSTTTPRAGEAMTVSGSGFTAGEQVTLELHSTTRVVGTATVRADGTFTTQITIPKDMYGRHLLLAVGGQPSCSVDPITLEIQASAVAGEHIGPSGDGLSSTGVQIALLLAIAAIALAAGVALVRAGRQKRARS